MNRYADALRKRTYSEQQSQAAHRLAIDRRTGTSGVKCSQRRSGLLVQKDNEYIYKNASHCRDREKDHHT